MPDPYSPTQPQIANYKGAFGQATQISGTPSAPVAGWVDQETLAPYAGGGGSGTVTSVTATDTTIVVSGTTTVAPTIARAAITGDVTIAAASNAASVVAIQGHAVSATAPTNLQVLQYQTGSTSYVPTTLTSTVTAAAIEGTFTAAGQIYLGTGSGTGEQLALGSANQVLTVNSGATQAAWATPGSGGTVTSVAATDGSIVVTGTPTVTTTVATGTLDAI